MVGLRPFVVADIDLSLLSLLNLCIVA